MAAALAAPCWRTYMRDARGSASSRGGAQTEECGLAQFGVAFVGLGRAGRSTVVVCVSAFFSSACRVAISAQAYVVRFVQLGWPGVCGLAPWVAIHSLGLRHVAISAPPPSIGTIGAMPRLCAESHCSLRLVRPLPLVGSRPDVARAPLRFVCSSLGIGPVVARVALLLVFALGAGHCTQSVVAGGRANPETQAGPDSLALRRQRR